MSFWDGRRWLSEERAEQPPQQHRLRDATATVVMILGFITIFLPLAHSSAADPTLTLTPASADIGSRVAVIGSNFPAKSAVQLEIDGVTAGMPKTRISATGAFKTNFTVPKVAPGAHTLGVMTQTSAPKKGVALSAGSLLATATLTVSSPVAPTDTPAPTPAAASTTPAPTSEPTPIPTPTATPIPTAVPTNTAAPTPAPVDVSSFVTRSGGQLLEGGSTFRFHGLNLYNINGDGDCGYWIPNLNTELDAIGSSANVVRGWFFQYLATNHATGARDWTKMDATLATLRAHGIRVIATLADQWGACEAAAPRSQLTQAWYQSGYKTVPYDADVSNSYREWVAEIVTRYRNDPTILAWQLMNEATAVSDASGSCPNQDAAAAALQGWAADMAGLVKSIDPNHLLSIGTSGSTQCGTTGSRYQALYATTGVDICESHDYTAPTVSISDGILFEIASCVSLNKPIFVGELGITGSSVGGSLTERATLFAAKFGAQMVAGMAGELVWAWRSAGDGGSSQTSWDIGPGDPTLGALAVLPVH